MGSSAQGQHRVDSIFRTESRRLIQTAGQRESRYCRPGGSEAQIRTEKRTFYSIAVFELGASDISGDNSQFKAVVGRDKYPEIIAESRTGTAEILRISDVLQPGVQRDHLGRGSEGQARMQLITER